MARLKDRGTDYRKDGGICRCTVSDALPVPFRLEFQEGDERVLAQLLDIFRFSGGGEEKIAGSGEGDSLCAGI